MNYYAGWFDGQGRRVDNKVSLNADTRKAALREAENRLGSGKNDYHYIQEEKAGD